MRRLGVVFAVLTLVIAGCSGNDDDASSEPSSTTVGAPAAQTFGIGLTPQTFVDESRPTPASGDQPAIPQRILQTDVLYPATSDPAEGAVEGAEPDASGGPYPLVVFSHGLGAAPENYQPLYEQWVTAGFVVAA